MRDAVAPSSPSHRRARCGARAWRSDPLIQAIVDDVHLAVDAPLWPGDPPRDVEDVANRAGKTRYRDLPGRRSRTSRDRSSTGEQLLDGRNAVAFHEILQPAPLRVLRGRSPDDLSAKVEAWHWWVPLQANFFHKFVHRAIGIGPPLGDELDLLVERSAADSLFPFGDQSLSEQRQDLLPA